MPTTTICLHGAMGTAAQFDQLKIQPGMPPVETLHFPGHGGTPCVSDFSNAIFADAILQKMNDLGLSQADLFGYSMGGYVALWMAWKYPDKVRHVTILNTKLDWTPETATQMTGMFNTEKIIAKAPQLAEAFAKAHAPGDWITVAQKTAQFLTHLGNGGAIPDDGFRQIGCPVRMLRGAQDNVVSEAECRTVLALLPDATYAEVPDSKHLMEQVDLEKLIQLITMK